MPKGFAKTAGDELVPPGSVHKSQLRARIRCPHGAKWHPLGVVDSNTIYTDVETASLTDASHGISAVCMRCPPETAVWHISAAKLRKRLQKSGHKVRTIPISDIGVQQEPRSRAKRSFARIVPR